jgi:hypothetical protein
MYKTKQMRLEMHATLAPVKMKENTIKQQTF